MRTVTFITDPADLDHAFAIRRAVFVDEQRVPAADEYDEFEGVSRHFLARVNGEPAGTARWRETPNGIKLERFAVLKPYRSRGVGRALVDAVLADIARQRPTAPTLLYLHAQLAAMPLYAGVGFTPVGPMFDECGIQHYKMVRPWPEQPAPAVATGPAS